MSPLWQQTLVLGDLGFSVLMSQVGRPHASSPPRNPKAPSVGRQSPVIGSEKGPDLRLANQSLLWDPPLEKSEKRHLGSLSVPTVC